MSFIDRLIRNPQGLWIRRALFQIHLWSGLGVGLYVVVISLSGSVLVYRSELRQIFNPEPRVVAVTGNRMSAEELVEVAQRAYPESGVSIWVDPEDQTHAVTLSLDGDGSRDQWLFDPYTGEDLGNAMPLGWRLTTWLLDLHDNLLYGDTGRSLNGVGAALLSLLGVTGAFIWWPGATRWWRSLLVDRRANWRRLTWSLHSATGFWTLAFVLMWGLTGIYLAFPAPFMATVDYLEPLDLETFEPRVGDSVLYWLASLHFGRFGGWVTKAVWAGVGLIPVLMFVTGTLMWWNRVVRRLQS